jgi:hypothetical protein
MKKLKTLVLMQVFLAFFMLTGCYDGWEPQPGGTGAGPVPPTAEPQIFHIELFAFYLSSSAVNSAACFGATGTELFRRSEWEERIAAIDSVIKNMAVTYSMTALPIAAGDCTNLRTIEDKALDSSYLDALTDDALDRPVVHVTAVFWNSDVPGLLGAQALKEHWASPQKLKDRGRKVSSLNYFSLSNSTTGKLSTWRSTRSILDMDKVLSATAIDQVDPTTDGQTNRRVTAIEDAKKVAAWISNTAGKR